MNKNPSLNTSVDLSTPLTLNALIKKHSKDIAEHWVRAWLLHILHKPSSFLIAEDNYVLSQQEWNQFQQGISQMQSGVPLAYLIGSQSFWSLEFMVNEHTLIPRPDTEVLVEEVLDWVQQNPLLLDDTDNASKRLLDLGTGSGCIAISLAYELTKASPKQWQVVAVDISNEALKVAKQNAILNQVYNIEFVQGSWFESLAINDTNNQFDIIVSNPPYIDDDDDNHLQYLKSEPIAALVAKEGGLADIKHIIALAKGYLQEQGLIAIEHGYNQGVQVSALLNCAGFDCVKTVKDYGGNDRVTMGIHKIRSS